ncbi:hypothetical protein BU24DRAFT_131145 [Aaosphaeria arxii CBS 175.79]|uniref:Uncharacterized protein n=1 Tax=Aaosphaeria arxii CBS 175.79 TaxID=1450172 RepID=A0A6A5Y618_9PLEO|nr:uncharacterized protein BU24DRAFT_131145 [Aaosphaeria arxii CBS 175.79]KAF2020004.1 hypothetical protein BU24DRAFT_131145 [Aaosphaeria arxii CBS 175.79]
MSRLKRDASPASIKQALSLYLLRPWMESPARSATMAPVSPSTLAPLQPSLSPVPLHIIKVQENIPNDRLNTLPITELQTMTTNCNSTIDQRLLVPALVEKQAELKLPQTELEHQSKEDGVFRFPRYNMAHHRPSPPSPAQQQHPKPDHPSTTTSTRHISESRKANRSIYAPERGQRTRRPQSTQIADLSPQSPTFGPRMGQLPSGTVYRRRCSLPANVPANPHPAGIEAELQRSQAALRTNQEKRMQWEAAWAWVEHNLEDCVQHIADDGNKSKAVDQFGASHDVWDELLTLKTEAEGLEARIKDLAGDGRTHVPLRSSI